MNNKTKIFLLVALFLAVGLFFFKSEKPTPPVAQEDVTRPVPDVVPEAETLAEQVPKVPDVPASVSEELSATMSELPTVKDLSSLDSEELHHTPDMVLEGGMLVGEMIEKAENDPARREETLKFLKACAENNDVIHQVRAVCWRKTLSQIPEWKIFLPISDANVPEDIKDLAMKLP